MKSFLFSKLLQNDGWIDNVEVAVDGNGTITSITPDCNIAQEKRINGYALPGFQNAHSHAFQYAMAGLAEVHDMTHTSDDFWSWRKAMYDLALSITPEQMESIATMLYSEMVRHGYTNVAEFHYVHHDKTGQHYSNLSEMGERMVSAAKTAGINITLVPIFYQKGGFGKPPTEGQRRFISPSIDEYLKLLEASKKSCSYYDGANIGIGIHSMRGVEPKDIAKIAQSGPQNIPFHIHISEQLKEIEDSISFLNQRPVEWLLDNVKLSDRFHLVHATHLTESEMIGLANGKANVVLCPSTEGNLGDGLFPLIDYQKNDGQWSIGTDSHIGINPIEELKLLDYGQRLISHKRNIFTSSEEGNSGDFAIKMATIAGRKAMNNFESNYFKVGEKLNASIIDARSPLLSTTMNEKLCAAILYTSDASNQLGTIINGKYHERNRTSNQKIQNDFVKTINTLQNR